MKTSILLLFLTSFLFSQSKTIYMQDLYLQLGTDETEFIQQTKDKGFNIKDNGNGNYYISKKVEETIYQANVRFVNNIMVSASKIWANYPLSNSFSALKAYFNLLEGQKDDNPFNVISTQRYTDINTEDFIVTNVFGEYRVEISFNKEFIIVEEKLYKASGK